MKKVFISHSHRDAEAAVAMTNLLLAAFDELTSEDILMTSEPKTGLRTGEIINDQLITELRTSPVFISLLSPAYMGSTYCIAEYAARWGAGKHPCCLRLPDLQIAELIGIFGGRNVPLVTSEDAISEFLETVSKENDWRLCAYSRYKRQLQQLCEFAPPSGQDFKTLRQRLMPESTPPFLNAFGLRQELRTDNIFQDFDCPGESQNTEPVQFLWADSRPKPPNWIKTELLRPSQDSGNGSERQFLRVHFEHNGGDGCDISIRPENEIALFNKHAYLLLDLSVGEGSDLDRIGVGLRLVNGYMQHWRLHQSRANRLLLCVDQAELNGPLRVDLQSSHWELFDADGTVDRGPGKPDFSIIASINLSLGGFKKHHQYPTEGNGVLDINELRLE